MSKGLNIVLLLSFLFTIPWLGLSPFYTRGEPREALTAQAMLQTGNWILPARYGDSFATKPPFTHWLMALASLPTGQVTEFTARLPTALLFMFLASYLYIFMAGRTTSERAFCVSAIFMSSLECFRASSTTRVDMALTTFIVIGLLELFKYSQKNYSNFPFFAVLSLSFATLVKGPVSIVLPLGIFCLFEFLKKRSLLKIFRITLILLVSILIFPSLWYLAAYHQAGESFVSVVMSENFKRFTSTMEDAPHKHSFLYLVGTLFLGFLPWTTLVLHKLFRTRSDLSLNKIRLSLKNNDLLLFAFLTAISFLAFFSIPASKRSVYLLPSYPFIVILFEEYINRLTLPQSFFQKFKKAGLYLFGILIIINAVILPLYSNYVSPKRFAQAIAANLNDNSRILAYKADFYAVDFYLNNKLENWKVDREISREDFVILYERDLPAFISELGSTHKYKLIARSTNPVLAYNQYALFVQIQ